MFYHFFLTIMRRVGIAEKLVNISVIMGCCFGAVLLSCTSCSKADGSSSGFTVGKTTVYVSVAGGRNAGQHPDSRTIISGDNLDEILWSEKDRIQFYYRTQGSADALAEAGLGVYRLYADEALFSGEISGVSADQGYDCYAVHPQPESVSGTTAVFDLPAVQNGLYDSSVDGTSHDIMVAEPVTGVFLGSPDGRIPMDFVHKCHAFRIQVPVDRNLWGVDIRKLRVEFPAAVVGKLSVDMADADAAPSLAEEGAGSTVWLDLKKRLNESVENSSDGLYAWIFTAPVNLDGEIRFTAYSEEGYQSETVSVSLSKDLAAGKITPVNLTVPQELPYSTVTLKIGENYLGEDYQTVTVTAPEGAKFRNGEQTVTFSNNESDTYSIDFYESYDGIDNLTPMKSADLKVEFESEHAIVSSEGLSLAEFQFGTEGVTFTRDVPYLLYEDFSGATSAEGEKVTSELSENNLPGWSASNYDISAGQGIRMRRYIGSAGLVSEKIAGRLDSPFLSGLKESNDSVSIQVSFDIGGTTYSDWLGTEIDATYAFGISKTSGAIDCKNEIESIKIAYEAAGTDGSYTNLPLHKDVVFNVTNEYRLTWRAMSNEPSFMIGTVYVYIDNIKVSIKSDNN